MSEAIAVAIGSGIIAMWLCAAALQMRLLKGARVTGNQHGHSCERADGNIGCIACVAYGATEEREAILTAIETAPPAFNFFGPYIPRDKLLAFLKNGDTQ